MNRYEITYITQQEQGNTALEGIENLGGKIISTQTLGLRKFAYPIAKKNSGYYFIATFEVEPKTINALEKKLQLDEKIIRFLIVHHQVRAEIIPPREIKPEEKKIEEARPIEEIPAPPAKEVKKPARTKKEIKAKEKEIKTGKETEERRLKDLDKELEKILME